MAKDFQNGYIWTYSAGIDQRVGNINIAVSYVGTASVKLASLTFPNGYSGADSQFAPFTLFDPGGKVLGGIGLEALTSSRAHSTFHSLQSAVRESSSRSGTAFQLSYTFGKSIDNASSVFGASSQVVSGALQQSIPQDPRNFRADKGPSTFDVSHAVSVNLIQSLPLDHAGSLRHLGSKVTSGSEILSISTLMSGSPFSVYSGVQQTGAGSMTTDRPDLIGRTQFPTARTIREDYFGLGANNADLFFIPLNVAGGSGPNQGRYGDFGA